MKRRLTAAVLSAAAALGLAAPAHAADFSDVAPGAWYAQAVDYCQTQGLMSGTGEGRFSPGAAMDRAMLAAVLHRVAGSPQASEAAGFTDVNPGSWYEQAVNWAAEAGITSGYGGGRFGPGGPVTREQLALFLWRLAGSPGPEGSAQSWADQGGISPYALQAVDWARSSGILSGVGGGRFDPQAHTTRAQAAVVLMNYNRLYNDQMLSLLDNLCAPSGITAMEDGTLLITDVYNKVVWQVKGGTSSVYAGGGTVAGPYGQPVGGYNDAGLAQSYFKYPWAVAPFLDGYAVSDAENNAVRLIRTESIQTVNGSTTERLATTQLGVAFAYPTGLAADEEGNLYVSDTHNNAVRKISPKGVVSTVAEGLSEPMGLCWHDGALYVAESGADRVVRIVKGRVELVAGSGQPGLADGPAAQAAFSIPQGITVGGDGTVYVSDTGNSAVRRVRGGVVDTLAARDMASMDICPVSPVGLLLRQGRLYVCDTFSHRVFVLDPEKPE